VFDLLGIQGHGMGLCRVIPLWVIAASGVSGTDLNLRSFVPNVNTGRIIYVVPKIRLFSGIVISFIAFEKIITYCSG